MGNLIFSDYGIDVYHKNGKFYAKYDAGELVVDYQEVEITEIQVDLIKAGPDSAYKVLVELQNIKK